ncbi:hypothetical protein E2P71_05245 [Candidatus Bathyarchaeota archaeon]|nr:hypothetical protein E2P71_05245 [Candidatus Bathyarchaeota archaeon]
MRYNVDNTERLKKFVELVRDKPMPTGAASVDWLKANDFKDRQDAQFLEILELLNFVDAGRKPNQSWAAFQDKSKTTSVMAKNLREAYSFMFQKYPDASNQSDANLQQIFVDRKFGKDQAGRAVKTFKTLLRFAGWM